MVGSIGYQINLQSCTTAACTGSAAGSSSDVITTMAMTSTAPSAKTTADNNKEGACAGCGEELKDGQALMALDKHYHVWCFKCKACGDLLHGEYMGKDGAPYCEKDYQNLFGVKYSVHWAKSALS